MPPVVACGSPSCVAMFARQSCSHAVAPSRKPGNRFSPRHTWPAGSGPTVALFAWFAGPNPFYQSVAVMEFNTVRRGITPQRANETALMDNTPSSRLRRRVAASSSHSASDWLRTRQQQIGLAAPAQDALLLVENPHLALPGSRVTSSDWLSGRLGPN